MKEADYNREVNKRLDRNLVRSWKIIDDYQGGVPDNYYHRKTPHPKGLVIPPLFVEFKFIKALPKRDNTLIVPALSSLQRDWLEELYVTRMRPKVIIGTRIDGKTVGVMLDREHWDGISKKEFLEKTMDYKDIAKLIMDLLEFQ